MSQIAVQPQLQPQAGEKREIPPTSSAVAPLKKPRAELVAREAWLAFLRRHMDEPESDTCETDPHAFATDFDDDEDTPADAAELHHKPGKGHEIPAHRIPDELLEKTHTAQLKQWKLCVETGSVRAATEEEVANLTKDANVLQMRWLITDKKAATRGNRTYEEVPAEMKARIIVPGYLDKDAHEGKLDTESPTLPEEAMRMILLIGED